MAERSHQPVQAAPRDWCYALPSTGWRRVSLPPEKVALVHDNAVRDTALATAMAVDGLPRHERTRPASQTLPKATTALQRYYRRITPDLLAPR